MLEILSEDEINKEIEGYSKEGLEVSDIGAGRYPKVPADQRRVGIAYTSWHRNGHWDNVWSKPVLGEYSSFDRNVIRKHAEWLYDAGVDFVWLDWSNNVAYNPKIDTDPTSGQAIIERGTEILFEEYSKLEKCPKISIFAGVTMYPEAAYDGRLQKKADQIYDMYVSKPQYRKLFEEYLGKPLLVVYVNTPSPWQDKVPEWDDARFTVRWMTGYVSEQKPLRTEERISKYGYWSWEDREAQTYSVYDNKPESMVVVASWRKQDSADGYNYIPEKGRRNGVTLKEQFARARLIGVKFVTVVSWNEWTRGEQPSPEVSKDLEPSEAFGDFYLKLLGKEIRKFKTID